MPTAPFAARHRPRRKRLRPGTFVQILDGAHDLGVEQPERVAEAVLDFLADEFRHRQLI